MTATRFLVERKNLRFPLARLEGEEHHHLSKVLRAKPGRQVWLVDEIGSSYEAEIIEVRESETLLRILAQVPPEETPVRLVLGQALLKSKKMDWVVQKATELGVDAIIPLATSRAIVKAGGGEGGRMERWRKIAREAAKQSRRSSLPEVEEPSAFRIFLSARPAARKLILTEVGGTALKDILPGGPGGPTARKSRLFFWLSGRRAAGRLRKRPRAWPRGSRRSALGKSRCGRRRRRSPPWP